MHDEEILEVRKIRHQISEECGHDLHKVAEYYRAAGKAIRRSHFHGEEVPTKEPLAEKVAGTASGT
jgi:hypothetical protein